MQICHTEPTSRCPNLANALVTTLLWMSQRHSPQHHLARAGGFFHWNNEGEQIAKVVLYLDSEPSATSFRELFPATVSSSLVDSERRNCGRSGSPVLLWTKV